MHQLPQPALDHSVPRQLAADRFLLAKFNKVSSGIAILQHATFTCLLGKQRPDESNARERPTFTVQQMSASFHALCRQKVSCSSMQSG